MGRRLLLVIVTVVLARSGAGRTFERNYGTSADECGVCLLAMADGGFVVAGGLESVPGFGAVFVLRTDSFGQEVWTTLQTEPGAQVAISSGTARVPDRLAVAGSVKAERIDHDMYAACLDTLGNRAWSWSSNLVGIEDFAGAICPSPDGGWLVCGQSLDAGQYDIIVAKLDTRGNRVWQRRFGSNYPDFANAVTPLRGGGYLVAGATYQVGSRYTDGYLARLDDTGAVAWSRTYGGALWDEAQAVAELSDGRFVLAGFSSSFGSGMDVWLQGVDSTGQGLWVRTYGNNESDRAFAVTEAPNRGLVVVGGTYVDGAADAYLVRANDEGGLLWQRWYGDTAYDCARSVAVLEDGGLAIVGQTRVDSVLRANCYLLRTDNLGTIAVAEPKPRAGGPGVRVGPSPFRQGLVVAASGTVKVRTAVGRPVRLLAAGTRMWDGCDAAGVAVPDGVYFLVGEDGTAIKVVRQGAGR